MTFMLQLEVVHRVTARAGEKNYGRLGLMLQYHCEVEHLFNVPSTAFTPAPKVGSAIVRIKPYKDKPIEAKDPKILETVIRTAFNQRRKTLRNSLKALLRESKKPSSVDLSLRPETLSLEDYVEISNALTGD
jgi:16S rRNA (adenine1518-N6/adenine1519-N6)-dimethyltransferase